MSLFAAGWLIIIALHYFAMTLSRGLIPPVVFSSVSWPIGTGVTAIGIVLLWCRTRWLGRLSCVTVAIAIAVFVASTQWSRVYVTTWYSLHRTDFAAVARLVNDGTLSSSPRDGYAGPKLPPDLRYLSVMESASRIGGKEGQSVWFLPTLTGIPDCAIGYAYFTGDPTKYEYHPDRNLDSNDYLDGYGCAVFPTIELGDGWWWVDRP
ncbi:hypothetical protein [Amycolatopsis taiwanensis]|uniref:hypothetical protein n=1 Tax=Amycolatopsis taiwanensis TaxID=342230 RepID=UPI0012ECA07D|nr:hypothetical protein [Amycolatopsis taiwanensis]